MDWFVKVDSTQEKGPYREHQIRRGLLTGKIRDPMRIRQGDSPWKSAAEVQQLFAALDARGFYVKDADHREYGPFTQDRIRELDAAGELPGKYWIRHCQDGPWTEVDRTSLHDATKRPHIPSAPVMRLREPRSWFTNLLSTVRTRPKH